MSKIEISPVFKPLNKHVLVALDSSLKKDSAIFIPDNIKERRFLSGVVLSISQDIHDEVYGVTEDGSAGESEGFVCDIEQGDRVFFADNFTKLKELRGVEGISVSVDGDLIDIDRLVCIKYDKLIAKVGA